MLEVEAFHEPDNAPIEYQALTHVRFMAPTHVKKLELFPFHEPYPLIPSFSPTGGEGARRAVEGNSDRFMAPRRDEGIVEATQDPRDAGATQDPRDASATPYPRDAGATLEARDAGAAYKFMKSRMQLMACAALLSLAYSLAAALMIPLSIEELTGQAQLVLQGRVLSKSCQRDATGRIYTKVELQVAEVWKGTLATNPLTVVHGGGILGEERVVVSGQVDYQIGEEIVAFLVFNPRGEAVTVGLAQGKFHVWKEPASGTAFVQNPFHGSPEAGARKIQAQNAAAPAPARLSLQELKARVQGGKP